MEKFISGLDTNLEPCNCIGRQVVDGKLQPGCPCAMRRAPSLDEWLNKRVTLTPAKGLPMPRTVEHYQANAIRDQDLILEQRDEIGRLKQRINKLEQRK